MFVGNSFVLGALGSDIVSPIWPWCVLVLVLTLGLGLSFMLLLPSAPISPRHAITLHDAADILLHAVLVGLGFLSRGWALLSPAELLTGKCAEVIRILAPGLHKPSP